MRRSGFFHTVAFIAFCVTPAGHARADGAERMTPRFETGLRLGSDRGITTTEVWAPVAQTEDSVLYGDIRFSRDDGNNLEGNLGVGYRAVHAEAVLGAHAWIDRRRTERGSVFNQATFGVEALGRDLDARANAYFPLSGAKTYATPNIGRNAPYLAGAGVFYDTNGTLVEEPQGGFDIELGYRLPLFEDHAEALRVYAGGYRFDGDTAPTVAGWRTRVVADVTPWLRFGARVQKDGERGTQSFIEATLRFPGKTSFKREGLRSRLDESPERDVDIVTSSKVTDTGIGKPVLHEAGSAQRVLHVDNTAAPGGNGSVEHPYNTLKAAESALQPYDVVYVHEGDGTTIGQDQGIVIDKQDIKLIGSGVDLVYQDGQVTAAANPGGAATVLARATGNPVITNTEASVSVYTGNGVLVTADNCLVAGLTAQGATLDGVRIQSNGNGTVFENATVKNITTQSNASYGLTVLASNNSRMQDVLLQDVVSASNAGIGVLVKTDTNAEIARVRTENLTASGNGAEGFYVSAFSGTIGNVDVENVIANGNATTGVLLRNQGGGFGDLSIDNLTANGNGSYGAFVWSYGAAGTDSVTLTNATASNNGIIGLYTKAENGSAIGRVSMSNVAGHNNVSNAIRVEGSGAGSAVDNVDIENAAASGTTGLSSGLVVIAASGGHVGPSIIHSVTAHNNGASGVTVTAQSGGTIDSATVSNINSYDNTQHGIRLEETGSGSILSRIAASNLTATGNDMSGIFVSYASGGPAQSASLSNITATGNTNHGLNIAATGGSTVAQVEVSGVASSANGQEGVRVETASAGSAITSATLTDIATSNNGRRGTMVYANTTSQLTATLSGIASTGSTDHGIYLLSQNSGNLSATLRDSAATSGSMNGVSIAAQTGGLMSARVERVTATGNTQHGLFVDDDTVNAFTADLGGGALASTGHNRIYGNAAADIRVDLDGGQLKAENNWWGVNTGLAGGETALDAGSTIDAAPFLTSDPGI